MRVERDFDLVLGERLIFFRNCYGCRGLVEERKFNESN